MAALYVEEEVGLYVFYIYTYIRIIFYIKKFNLTFLHSFIQRVDNVSGIHYIGCVIHELLPPILR
jgi:hypothetical protein